MARRRRGLKKRHKAGEKIAVWKRPPFPTRRQRGIETLNVRGMAKNRSLARSVMDGGFQEFRRQLEYKAKMFGSILVSAGRFEPSSKTCSCCGVVKATLALSERTFACDDCGAVLDRDHNAARNLERLAVSYTASACGEEGSGGAARRRETGLSEAGTEQQSLESSFA